MFLHQSWALPLALEEGRANGEPIDDVAIQGVKVGMMNPPLAGVGDLLVYCPSNLEHSSIAMVVLAPYSLLCSVERHPPLLPVVRRSLAKAGSPIC